MIGSSNEPKSRVASLTSPTVREGGVEAVRPRVTNQDCKRNVDWLLYDAKDMYKLYGFG